MIDSDGEGWFPFAFVDPSRKIYSWPARSFLPASRWATFIHKEPHGNEVISCTFAHMILTLSSQVLASYNH